MPHRYLGNNYLFIQIEISTHCNFSCFYCAGRDMAQEYMQFARFNEILDRLPTGQHVVCLQGEGEPMLHPNFWKMVEHLQSRCHTPYTITNGTRIDAVRIAATFPRIAISIDTLDPAEAECIGRKKLDKVLRNLDRLIEIMGSQRLVVMTVDYGQPLDELKAFVQAKGIGEHIVQPLQIKDDYRRRYPDFAAPATEYTYRCRYLEQPLQRTYGMDGREYPCCYIKDPAGFTSIDDLRTALAQKTVPPCCSGCREIVAGAVQPKWLNNIEGRADSRIAGLYSQILTDLSRLIGVACLSPGEQQAIYHEIERTVLTRPTTGDTIEIRVNLPPRLRFISQPGLTLRQELVYRLSNESHS